ncbi:MAG: RpiB/LacA/LacB family sugar-phosphate isomerase [Verrucomicrobia bacterium]|nr:RpiB/LacA/LacB family sugar-phosphate isomerase [Verrucomicrobiota bacterium]
MEIQNSTFVSPIPPKRVGIAADHGGFELKHYLAERLRGAGHETIDFGNGRSQWDDDYPDYVVPLARAVADGDVERGVAICGSGVGVASPYCSGNSSDWRSRTRGKF